MKTYSGLEKLEININKKYYSHEESPAVRMFADKDNPDAYDANFAVLKSIDNIEQSVKLTEIFHEAVGAVPLFVHAPDSVSLADARQALEPFGYSFCDNEQVIMATLPRASYKHILPLARDVRMHTSLNGAEREFIIAQKQGLEYAALMLDKKLLFGAKLFIAYDSDKAPVSSCFCESYGEGLYINSVFTRESARRLGYAHAVLCTALQYAFEKSYANVYLHVNDSNARALYERFGFSEQGVVNYWKAFKGELP